VEEENGTKSGHAATGDDHLINQTLVRPEVIGVLEQSVVRNRDLLERLAK
jgi:hypothetical protein